MAGAGVGQEDNKAAAALRTVVAGIVSGFLAIVLSIGFANLILVGEMRGYTPVIIGMTLFSTMTLNAIAAFTSPIRGAISVIQEVPVVVLGSAATVIAASMASPGPEALATIVVFCMVTTVLTGLLLFVLGTFGLGGLVRFVPFPVVGGFLAGTGWLIMFGGLTVILGEPVGLDSVARLADGATAVRLAVALGFVAAVVALSYRSEHPLAVPGAILIALIAYNAVVLFGGLTPEFLSDNGWLIAMPNDGRLWPPLYPADLGAVDWGEVAHALISFPGLFAVSVLALLMNATGIEIDRGHDLDLNRELRAVGVQNMVAGPTGGIPGYISVSLTLLASRLGGQTRGAPAVVAVLAGSTLFFGDIVLRAMPTPLLGSLLLWIGGSLIVAWVWRSSERLSLPEYAIIVLIFLVIVVAGFTWGILVGLVAAVGLFVVEYSRADVVRQALSGRDYQSGFAASGQRREALRRHGNAIAIYRLQGYLFFGTAESLRKRIVQRVAGTPTDFVLIDMRRVTGIDSSAIASFQRLARSAERDGFAVVLAGARDRVRLKLTRGGLGDAGEHLRFEDDAEAALMSCENALLDAKAPETRDATAIPLEATLTRIFGNADDAGPAAAFFQRAEFDAGDTLIEEGASSDEILLIESGRAAVTTGAGKDGRLMLAGVGPGAIVGEIAFYLGSPRLASVAASEPTVAWRFTRADLDRLEANAPHLAAALHKGLAAMLAERVAATDRLVRYLAD